MEIEYIDENAEKFEKLAQESIIPLGNKVLVVRDEVATKKGSIYLVASSDNSENIPVKGKVLALGSGVTNKELEVGVKVYFPRYAGVKIPFEDKEVLFLTEVELLGIHR